MGLSKCVTPALLAGCLALLSACGGGRDMSRLPQPEPAARTTTVAGYVIDGPLEGARVRVYGAGDALLGETVTGVNGYYGVIVIGSPPLRVTTEGGSLDGAPYAAGLAADCEVAARCHVTPWTTVLARLVDRHGLDARAARALAAARLGGAADPFLAALPDHPPVAAFDLAAARRFIGRGARLPGWVDDAAAWMVGSSAAPPAGITAHAGPVVKHR